MTRCLFSRVISVILLQMIVLHLAIFTSSCKMRVPVNHDDRSLFMNNENLSDPDQKNKLELLEKNDLITRPKVHAIRLDSGDFRVSGLRVGEEVFYRYATPVVFFTMPQDSDYVEILRCPDNVIIHGGRDVIDYADMGSTDLNEEVAVFARNNFWEAAVATSGCVMVASSYTDSSFEDTFAPTGSYHYYIRACVDEDRLTGTEDFGHIHCSRMVSRSLPHRHKNQRSREELQALEKAASFRSRIDTLNRRIVDVTMEMNQQLYDCQERHQQKVVTKEKKKSISNIIAGVTALGIPAISAMVGFRSRAAVGTSVAVGIGSAAVLSSLYVAASQTVSAFPRDAEACYDSGSTEKIVGQVRNQNAIESQDHALLCSCGEALASQGELYTLTRELENQLDLQQVYLNRVTGMSGQNQGILPARTTEGP
ncbi:MAG: hypothetical protein H6618_08340 [Deltaproteobacteria bacterium]|nr:hypothetical protein [Deltaproteobacteria bacterium]